MELKLFLKEKFQYNFEKNEELIKLLIKNPNDYDERISVLTSHSLNAHEIWNSRIMNEKSKYGVWDIHHIDQLEEINQIVKEVSFYILKNLDLSQDVIYFTSNGQKFQSKIHEMLFQIVNHSTYHRGQIYQLLKAKDIQPPLTDYIFYSRNSM